MLKNNRFLKLGFVALLFFTIGFSALADTIRLKDGSIIKGKVIAFKDQQFVILVGDDSRGRQRQMSFFMDEIDSIEFDGASPIKVVNDTPATPEITADATKTGTSPTTSPKTTETPKSGAVLGTSVSKPDTAKFFRLNVRVLADATANGWTNANLVVKKGQRIRVTASGRIALGNGRYATPAGLNSLPDNEKLMKRESTGGLIAVIGDDNNEFIFIGNSKEFVAPRDGLLFFGVNEGNLDDNSGSFDVTVEAEAGVFNSQLGAN